jgi:hypothetical protein
MKRILIVNGSFSSLVLSSILKNQNNRENNTNVSNFCLGYFKNVSPEKSQELFNFFNLLIDTDKNINFFAYKKNFVFDFNELSHALNTTSVDEIYIPINSSTKKIHKLFMYHYPKASFIFYEEGLMSYIKPLFDKSLRKIMAKSENYYLFYDEKLKNLLSKSFPKINFKTIIKEKILENIKTVQSAITGLIDLDKANNMKNLYSHNTYRLIPSEQNEIKYCLVLPQYYHQGNNKKTEKIIAMYYNNMKNIIDNGYKIIFKDHPKAKLKYSDTLKNMFSPENFILFEDLSNKNLEVFPVEVVANVLKIDMVFSVYSTSLFTFKHLFNIRTFTSYKMLEERENIWSIYPTFSALITKNIISNLFDNKQNSNKLLYSENKLLKILILMLKLIHKYKE